MKLVIDCRMLGKSGIGAYLDGVLPELLKSTQTGNSFLLIGNAAQLSLYPESSSVKHLLCDIEPFTIRELLFFPHRLSKEINKCDVYYSPYCNIPGGIRIPVYTTIHDVVFLDISGLAGRFGTILRKWFYQHALNKSCTVFTVSQFSAERIRANLAVHTAIVVTYGAPQRFISIHAAEAHQAKKENYFLFVGNIKKHKGLQTLIPAFLQARKKGLSAKLVIAGNAENFRSGNSDELSEMLKAAPADTISFTGKISDEQLLNLYAKALLLVQPSLYEGFGMPPLEALTCGTNVLISDIPVFREIYSGFPVTYFRAGNVEDLSDKMIDCSHQTQQPVSLPDRYSFSNTAHAILDAVCSKSTQASR